MVCIVHPVSLLSLAVFCLADLWYAIRQLAWGIYDHTHYHLEALHYWWSAGIFNNYYHLRMMLEEIELYFSSMPRNFTAHFAHRQYLRRLGIINGTSSDNSLSDNGTLVWKSIAPEGNSLDNGPAQRVTGILGNASGNPAHLTIASLALDKLWTALDSFPTFLYTETAFVDFGCGTGLTVVAALTRPFAEVTGVELHGGTAAIAQRNVDRFLVRDTHNILVRCESVAVRCMDMSDFDFASCAAPAVLLYMYEPLWMLRASDAHIIYERILRNAVRSGKRVTVAYFFCGTYRYVHPC